MPAARAALVPGSPVHTSTSDAAGPNFFETRVTEYQTGAGLRW